MMAWANKARWRWDDDHHTQVGNKVVLAIQGAGIDLAPSLEGKAVVVPVPKCGSMHARIQRPTHHHPCLFELNCPLVTLGAPVHLTG
jgi:hypothetical protein